MMWEIMAILLGVVSFCVYTGAESYRRSLQKKRRDSLREAMKEAV